MISSRSPERSISLHRCSKPSNRRDSSSARSPPRMLDTHPEAIKVPYAHSNVQADEVLYYVRGRFGSRRGVEEASITLHPRGIPHGPHPGTIAASRAATRTDELAVMVDTFGPLRLTRQAMELDDPSYPLSWID